MMLEYDKNIRVLGEMKPNEPMDHAYLPTTGHFLALCYKTLDPSRVGILIESAHALLAGLDPAIEMAYAIYHGKLWSVHLNDQNGLKFDEDRAFGAVNLKRAFDQVFVLYENDFGAAGEFVGLDVKALRTQKDDMATRHLSQQQADLPRPRGGGEEGGQEEARASCGRPATTRRWSTTSSPASWAGGRGCRSAAVHPPRKRLTPARASSTVTHHMAGLALGAAAFLLIFWVDAVSLQKMRLVKPLLWLAGIALSVAGLVVTVREPPRVRLPAPVSVAGWALGAVCTALFVYSLFVEIPFASAYVQKGMPSRLVTEGTYALCRHPGVLWLAGLLAGVFLASGSLWMLAALPLWIGLDVLYVVLQERLYFVRIFGDEYRQYQCTVPMLVPTSHSVGECARTIFGRGKK